MIQEYDPVNRFGAFVPLDYFRQYPNHVVKIKVGLGEAAEQLLELTAMHYPDGRVAGLAVSYLNELQHHAAIDDATAPNYYYLPVDDPSEGSISVGRSSSNAISTKRYGDATISRHHAQIGLGDTQNHGFGVMIKDLGSTNGTYVRRGGVLHMGGEVREHEHWPKFYYGLAQASKNQLLNLPIKRHEKYGVGDDSSLCVPSRGLFGVMDGVGGQRNSSRASKMTAQVLKENILCNPLSGSAQDAEWELRQNLLDAHVRIRDAGNVGMTTATVCQMMPELTPHGYREIPWVSVGDSRIYYYDSRTKTATQITEDEGEGNVITNAVGSSGFSVAQHGIIMGRPGDKVLLVTDGITGDKEPDLMTDGQIAAVLARQPDNTKATKKLLDIASKIDDRTAILITIPGA